MLCHRDAIIYVALGVESIYLVLLKAKMKHPKQRQKKVDTRYVNFRNFARKLQYEENVKPRFCATIHELRQNSLKIFLLLTWARRLSHLHVSEIIKIFLKRIYLELLSSSLSASRITKISLQHTSYSGCNKYHNIPTT